MRSLLLLVACFRTKRHNTTRPRVAAEPAVRQQAKDPNRWPDRPVNSWPLVPSVMRCDVAQPIK